MPVALPVPPEVVPDPVETPRPDKTVATETPEATVQPEPEAVPEPPAPEPEPEIADVSPEQPQPQEQAVLVPEVAFSVKGVSAFHIRLIVYAGTNTHGALRASTIQGWGVECGPMNSSPRMIVTFVISTDAQMMLGMRIQFLPFV